MQARMQNPESIFPDASRAIADVKAAVDKSRLSRKMRNLAQIRVSQINGSSSSLQAASNQARKAGETDVRMIALNAWRESPYYTDAERAALALTEAVTRLEGAAPVPDDVWRDASKHFDEQSLAALLLTIAITNATDRFSVSTRQVAGT
jgi:AhpD family alkylhydroperoxidase